ncbi:MAG TPA: N-acetylmuramoyl-L-alanine amidase [Candidatus Limnocylindria bacterium]|nr:N-acetylmuramoyl-L-alanine amidase [Candidatus Limnocylindria bacterium]
MTRLRGAAALLAVLLGLAACAPASPTPSGSPAPSAPVGSPTTEPTVPGLGEVIPAPGSSTDVYAPNPEAVVVAIDPGHGGCLDWGVPDPSRRGAAYSEKTMTLGIAREVERLLSAQGVTVVMMRERDEALAGDDYPDLGCTGPAWRDVDGDGQAGFEETGRVRTRDELQARIDRANVARADVMVSIHINSMTQNGVVFEIAATQTFYDDETPWGVDGSGVLAGAIQADVVAALDPVAAYERQDRGTQAVAYYAISRQWQDGDSCETPGDTWCKPHRALQMPSALAEVGSITLRAEQDLLVSESGQTAAAEGVYRGVIDYLADRSQAVRYDVPDAVDPPPSPDGPLEQARILPVGDVELVLTNRGMDDWPADLELVAGWEASELPYLPLAPNRLDALAVDVPSLGPGESVRLVVSLPVPDVAGRQVAWITLRGPAGSYADLGSPALQLASMERSSG